MYKVASLVTIGINEFPHKAGNEEQTVLLDNRSKGGEERIGLGERLYHCLLFFGVIVRFWDFSLYPAYPTYIYVWAVLAEIQRSSLFRLKKLIFLRCKTSTWGTFAAYF